MNLRPLLIFVVGLSLTGCTAEYYERQADREVLKLVKDREDKTLGYRPEVEAPSAPNDAKPSPAAFAKIPATPILPKGDSQVEAARVELEHAPLGPRRFAWADGGLPEQDADATPMGEGNKFDSLDATIRGRLVYGPPSLAERPIKLDFFECLSYGVRHGRAYQTQMEELYLAALRVTLERHLFTPRPFATSSLEWTQDAADARGRRAAALRSVTQAGVRQRLPYGGEIVASGLVRFVDALHGTAAGGERAEIVLSGSIPLLRGAGMVNLEPLIAGERGLVYQVRAFESFRRDFVIDLATQYFRLINLQQSVLDRRVNYASFVTLTERSRALFAAGRVASIELQRSLQELLSAENRLINAQEDYRSALDDFKLFLGMPTEQALEIVPVELDVDLPALAEAEAVELGLKYRLDLQTARDQVEDARRGAANAKNGLLPDLNLTADATFGNRGGTDARALDDRASQYSAGIELDLPLDRVEERNRLRAALIEVRQAQRSAELLKDQVATDVRESLRRIEQSRLTLNIQRQGIELAKRRRENAYALFLSGKSLSTRDLVEAQNSLLNSLDQFENARATLQVNVLRFLRDSGTLRLDPEAGAVGHAMARAAGGEGANNSQAVR